MTVRELIKELEDMPGDARVITHGYEGGYSDVTEIVLKALALNVNPESYYGAHDDAEDGDSSELGVLL